MWVKEPDTQEEIDRDRQRLVARDVFAILIDNFVKDDERQELEIICPEPGTILGDARVIESEGVDPVKMHSRIYTIALRGHWLKREVWVRKIGRSVWITKYDTRKQEKE